MEDELYLENIDEFVTDQNRVVTYKWLSYTLGVHVNQAKQMLYDYVEKRRKENSGAQLHVTYLVAGNLVQNGHTCHKVAVVKEDKLAAMKLKLSTIASVHVYSIQKAVLKDSGPLYNTDYDIIKANLQNCSKFSAIHCAAAVARTAAEMSRIDPPAQAESQPPGGTNAAAVPVINGHAPSTSAKQTSQQAKGIMGMFAAKSAARSQDTHKEAKVEAKETPSASTASNKAPAKGNLLNNFFGKAALSKISSEAEQQKEEKSGAKSPVESRSPSGTAGLEKPGKKAEPVKVQQKDKKRYRKILKRVEISDEEEEEAERLKKKRRRIKPPQSDSSNEEDVPESPLAPEEKDLSPAPVPKPPMPEPVPMEASVGEKRRKRKRVLKSKTFVDEEGCMVTEKVYESESCTDSEEEFRSKPPAARRPPAGPGKKDPKEERKGTKKGAASKAPKQASIMGFFQKK
ncbi:DNA polymerase delta subunit 3 isoform X2 [Hemicordylus capensis]|uniref:DNA polymerase delta subunit 3 isoform X2 n=1 Tax=Hemicordylus capensis TaxID=884348 RepID=UPI00230469EB|nr:DNA polymerase delta subunit 3 isoform X2 [Hemicordylus capensis]